MDDDEDLAEVDRMERFESKFNFRFEEEEAARQAVKAKSAATFFFPFNHKQLSNPGLACARPMRPWPSKDTTASEVSTNLSV
jgi:hypothetical protein